MKVKNEHEEKKARYIGNIFANTAFDIKVSPSEANYLLKLVDGFTYKQLCLLALYRTKFCDLRKMNYRTDTEVSWDTYSILLQLMDLYSIGLMACKNEKGDGNDALLGAGDICPNRMFLTPIAMKYCDILGLADIPREDLVHEVVKYLIMEQKSQSLVGGKGELND